VFGRRTRLAALGAVSVGACAVLAACSPVKLGAAAVVGNQRITLATLDTQVSNLQDAAAPYGSQVQLTAAQMPATVLSWLIKFAIQDQATASAGISLTEAQVQQGIAEINSEAASAASEDGFSSGEAVLLSAGISPQLLPAVGRYQAQEIAYVEKVNGGKLPSTTAQDNTVTAALTKSQCEAAKVLDIQVSPQFGRLDYTDFTVVSAANVLSQPAGKPSPASTTGLAPAC
jgi:SurA N-terminal domain